jgi:hypothetical protein
MRTFSLISNTSRRIVRVQQSMAPFPARDLIVDLAPLELGVVQYRVWGNDVL